MNEKRYPDWRCLLDGLHDPDPTAVAMLHELLADGCGSPLYNPNVHVSELLATLYYAHSRLEAESRDTH